MHFAKRQNRIYAPTFPIVERLGRFLFSGLNLAVSSQESSKDINDLYALVKNFTVDQLHYITVRPFVRSNKEAAKRVGIAAETVSRWENKADVDRAIQLMILDGVVVASEMLRRYIPQATEEFIDELSNKRVDIRHKAAREILDRGGLPTKQHHEVSGLGGEPLFPIDDIVRALKQIDTDEPE